MATIKKNEPLRISVEKNRCCGKNWQLKTKQKRDSTNLWRKIVSKKKPLLNGFFWRSDPPEGGFGVRTVLKGWVCCRMELLSGRRGWRSDPAKGKGWHSDPPKGVGFGVRTA